MLLEQHLIAELTAEWHFQGYVLLSVFVVFSKNVKQWEP